MPNWNYICMIGHLTRDPQLSYTPNQTAVVDFGIATNRKWQDGSGQQREEVCFIDCRGFGKTAENINKFFKKGRAILVAGRLSFDQWEDKNGGGKRSKHRITVESWTFVGDGQRSDSTDEPQPTGGSQIPDGDVPF